MSDVVIICSAFVILMVMGVPIYAVIGFSVAIALHLADIPQTMLAQTAFTALQPFPLLSIPLFVLAGRLMEKGGMANHLIKITKSTGLMGCTSLVSGISPEIAQTMVNLGFDVSEISTSATLHDALERAFRLIGRTVSEMPRA